MSTTTVIGLPDPTRYLLDEEQVALVVRRNHPIVLAPAAALAGLIVVAVLVLLLTGRITGAGLFVGLLAVTVVGGWFFYRWIHWSRTVLVVTNRRLFEFVSLGIKRITVLPVARQSIVYRQSPFGRAMGFGRVQVKTPNGATLHDFGFLEEPARFRDEVANIAA